MVLLITSAVQLMLLSQEFFQNFVSRTSKTIQVHLASSQAFIMALQMLVEEVLWLNTGIVQVPQLITGQFHYVRLIKDP